MRRPSHAARSSPSRDKAFPTYLRGGPSPPVEAVDIFDDQGAGQRELLGLQCTSGSEGLVCWLRRENDGYRIIRVDSRYPSLHG